MWYSTRKPPHISFEPVVQQIRLYEQVVERESLVFLHAGETHRINDDSMLLMEENIDISDHNRQSNTQQAGMMSLLTLDNVRH